MSTFYIDESGSMTKKNLNHPLSKHFVICIIKPNDYKKLKTVFKRFISSNYEKLKKCDKDNKMFTKSGKFKELKGCALNSKLKREFINYFCRNNLFEVYYIYCTNKMVQKNFYNNTSRAFNYLLKIGFEYFTKNKIIEKDNNHLYIDERNVRTNTKSTLQEYLNTELVTGSNIQKNFCVEYMQSESLELIQLADTFSNIFYSNLITKTYDNEIMLAQEKGYIKFIFKFPL